ncbi:sigma factor [Nonomuraea thailandensis]
MDADARTRLRAEPGSRLCTDADARTRLRAEPGSRLCTDADVERLLRVEAPQVLGALVRRFGRFEIAEDAVQEALLAASRSWPADGVPDNPRSWLIRIGYRRMVDLLRADQARRRREREAGVAALAMQEPARHPGPAQETDDSLALLLLCCHPALSATSQVALTLRRGRPDDRRDRARVRDRREHHGHPDQPRQTTTGPCRRPLHPAHRRRP